MPPPVNPGKRFPHVYLRQNASGIIADHPGCNPSALILDSRREIYGFTSAGGAHHRGSFFHLAADGCLSTLYSFQHGSPERLVSGADSCFYGTCWYHDLSESYSFFKLTPEGVLKPLLGFRNGWLNSLLRGNDGNFYATLSHGGNWVVRITPEGELTRLYEFANYAHDLAIVQGGDGALYGVDKYGGSRRDGEVFRLTLDGELTPLHAFSADGDDGYAPDSIAQGSDGSLYGTTCYSGDEMAREVGTIFRIDPARAFTTLHQFRYSNESPDEIWTEDQPRFWTQDGNGGMCVVVARRLTPLDAVRNPAKAALEGMPGVSGRPIGDAASERARHREDVFQVIPDGTVTRLISFDDGERPTALVALGNNTWIGTARGASNIFMMEASGRLTVLYSFRGDQSRPGLMSLPANLGPEEPPVWLEKVSRTVPPRPDLVNLADLPLTNEKYALHAEGFGPTALLYASDDDFYGLTQGGGEHDRGTAFHMTSEGRSICLCSFRTGTPDRLLQGVDGDFYGTTRGREEECGTFFRLSAEGELTTLHEFSAEGGDPDALILGLDGHFYGAIPDSKETRGSIFRITAAGDFTILHDSISIPLEEVSLAQGEDGAFYGTSAIRGEESNEFFGTIFRMTLTDPPTALHAFSVEGNGGHLPESLVLGRDGSFYGTTRLGGYRPRNLVVEGLSNPQARIRFLASNGSGTVFRMTPAGSLSTLFTFTLPETIFPAPPSPTSSLADRYSTCVRQRSHEARRRFLVVGSNGDLYGVEQSRIEVSFRPGEGYGMGQASLTSARLGNSVLFKITPDGGYTRLPEGMFVEHVTSLVEVQGILYGTSLVGGTSQKGSVFKIDPDGRSTLCHFGL